jgi:hypothetical protein
LRSPLPLSLEEAIAPTQGECVGDSLAEGIAFPTSYADSGKVTVLGIGFAVAVGLGMGVANGEGTK